MENGSVQRLKVSRQAQKNQPQGLVSL